MKKDQLFYLVNYNINIIKIVLWILIYRIKTWITRLWAKDILEKFSMPMKVYILIQSFFTSRL